MSIMMHRIDAIDNRRVSFGNDVNQKLDFHSLLPLCSLLKKFLSMESYTALKESSILDVMSERPQYHS